MMNGIDTIIQRLNTDAKAETDALLEKARQEAAAVAARYQAQADKEAADLAARNERLAAEREERLISAAQMEARKTVLAAKQAVMEETYAKALEKLRNLPEARYVEVLTELLLQAAPHGVGEVLFSAQDRETVGQAAVDAANGKSGGKLTLSGETAPIQGGFILKDGNVEVNCAFDTLVRLQKKGERFSASPCGSSDSETGGFHFSNAYQRYGLSGDLRPCPGHGDHAADGGAHGASAGGPQR